MTRGRLRPLEAGLASGGRGSRTAREVPPPPPRPCCSCACELRPRRVPAGEGRAPAPRRPRGRGLGQVRAAPGSPGSARGRGAGVAAGSLPGRASACHRGEALGTLRVRDGNSVELLPGSCGFWNPKGVPRTGGRKPRRVVLESARRAGSLLQEFLAF